MPRSLSRHLYRFLLRLHPPIFTRRFGDEILGIFDEAAATHSVVRLFAGALMSLMRQWVMGPQVSQTPNTGILTLSQSSDSVPAVFVWQHFDVAIAV